MGYRFEVNKNKKIIFLYRFGKIDKNELRESVREIFSTCKSNNIRKILNDLTEVDATGITPDDLYEHGKFIARHLKNKNFRLAIIAPSDLTYGLARMFEVFANLDGIMVFRSRDEALSWLSVPS